jgi:hypothetical protein
MFPDCHQATRLQSEALDRKLPVSKRLGLHFHLLFCKWCRRYGRHISFLRTACEHSAEEEHAAPAQTLSPEARERIRRALNGDRN